MRLRFKLGRGVGGASPGSFGMMTLLGILVVLLIAGWIVVTAFQRSMRHPKRRRLPFVACALAVVGVALGVFLLTREYLASPTVRLAGLPFAVGGYEFVDGRWRGGLVSRFVVLAILADIASGMGICLLPLRVALSIIDRGARDEGIRR